jgi:putative Mg2+ transporter-C (MgtC) family protein
MSDIIEKFLDADQINQLNMIGNVALGMLLGGLIGLEREHAEKPAGFRTHMLVAGAATLLVVLANTIGIRFSNQNYAHALRFDPLYIIQAIVTGISFLGAGTIFRSGSGDEVKGLTTAASLLFAGAIGIAVALQQWLLASCLTLLVLVVLAVFRWFEHRIGKFH